MPRGTFAFVVVASLVLSMTLLNGLGYYALMGAEIDVSGQNKDVQAAADNLDGIEFGEGRSSAILQGPLAAVVPFVRIFQSFTTVLGNTSGVVQLLYGVPPAVADPIEVVFRLMMLVTIGYGIRSGSPI
jgi:hypothetical protein